VKNYYDNKASLHDQCLEKLH